VGVIGGLWGGDGGFFFSRKINNPGPGVGGKWESGGFFPRAGGVVDGNSGGGDTTRPANGAEGLGGMIPGGNPPGTLLGEYFIGGNEWH